MTIKRYIKVKTEFVGIHCWPECPYEEVKFLRNPHRHIFKVEAKVEVMHSDRDIEFFVFKQVLDHVIKDLYGDADIIDLGRKSCEQIAIDIYNGLQNHNWSERMIISVSEDGENGAEVEFSKDE